LQHQKIIERVARGYEFDNGTDSAVNVDSNESISSFQRGIEGTADLPIRKCSQSIILHAKIIDGHNLGV
jgi:hypothetical protein